MPHQCPDFNRVLTSSYGQNRVLGMRQKAERSGRERSAAAASFSHCQKGIMIRRTRRKSHNRDCSLAALTDLKVTTDQNAINCPMGTMQLNSLFIPTQQ